MHYYYYYYIEWQTKYLLEPANDSYRHKLHYPDISTLESYEVHNTGTYS
jgi:hypothetical protein